MLPAADDTLWLHGMDDAGEVLPYQNKNFHEVLCRYYSRFVQGSARAVPPISGVAITEAELAFIIMQVGGREGWGGGS